MIRDVSEATWGAHVIERSREVPVVVDFWAEWCAPCRKLTPVLEAAAHAREGKIDLAKVDVDANKQLSQQFQVQGIPAVKAFRDGEVAGEFTGAIGPTQVEQFFGKLVPSEADGLAGSDDEADLRKALELDPGLAAAAQKLGRILLERGEAQEALEVLDGNTQDFVVLGLAARAKLQLEGDEQLTEAWTAWDSGDPGAALEVLQQRFAAADGEVRDLLRQAMVAIFTELGPDHELAREHRRRLSAAMF